ncbi:hypothetical protein [Chryseobacterium sp. FH2]|uniref:hypothetical protein n=1 Tax=Chryseobacterium sp. FH2 TaxID=1674291 RepID=UPI000AB08FDE|nr:hypothetical protein [Chryseobacterium sp. FH2]
MTKNLFLVLPLAVQIVFGQIISKDLSVASNGIYPVTDNNSWSRMVQNLDGSLYFTHSK